ncbi:Dual specificity tyrosine-phosphorylation-regulated kinase 3 [Taenia solium]|eukprot:TsM_000071200 transcript=TsM_000071200 gene=TsM_000071200
MSKEFAKRLSFRLNGRKNFKDTTYHEIPHDHIDYRYECIRSIGKGSFGNVLLVIDHKEGKECALKVVRRDIRFTTQAKEEIAILELLQKSNPNPKGSWDHFPIVRLMEHFMFREHMCLSFELLGCSLYDLIKDKKDQGLPRDRVRRLMDSVLSGLSYVWNAGIIHCDLKPENVLLVSRAPDGGPETIRDLVKIIDFGSSCFVGKQCYPYIQSRFYRAPEVIMRLEYSQPIDMWSFGCLVFEMIRGYPLFPGEDEFDQLACMMEKLGMPPFTMVGLSRVFSRYFTEVESTRKYYRPQDRQTPLKFIPRYCTIRQVSEGVAELQPNLSKKARRLRKPPGAVPVAQALVSTLSHSSGKYTDSTPTPLEEMDNTHVVKLIEACLSWVPEKRINPDQAKNFSWFNYKYTHHNGLTHLAQSPRSTLFSNPSATSSKYSSDSSQVSLLAENISLHKASLPNGGFVTMVPVCTTNTAAAPMPTILPSSPHNTMAARNVTNQMYLANSARLKNNMISVSPPGLEPHRKHGSSASTSSAENKQEERVLYPRKNNSQSPKYYIVGGNLGRRYNTDSLEKKVSDTSHGSSIDDVTSRTIDILRYTKRNGVQMNEYTRSRRRNQSMEPKRHTQPVGSEEMTKGQSIIPSSSYICSETAARSSSSEEDSERSGRHNPNSFSKTSQLDISAVDRLAGKASHLYGGPGTSKVLQYSPPNPEASTSDRRQTLTITRSVREYPENLIENNLDDLGMPSTRRPLYGSVRRQKRYNSRDLKESTFSMPGTKSSPQHFTVPSITRSYVTKDGGGKSAQPHADYRRRNAGKSYSTTQLTGSRDMGLTNSHSEMPTNSRLRLSDAVDDDSKGFMSINKVQSSTMVIKPQT